MYCETIEFPQEKSDAILYGGVWSYRTSEYTQVGDETWVITTCRSYSYLSRDLNFDYELDARARTTMAFSLMAVFFGGLGVIFAYFYSCMGTVSEARWKMIGNTFFFTCLLQGLTLFLHTSSLCLDNPVLQYLESGSPTVRETFGDECEWGTGYELNISSVALWFVAGVSTYVFKPPQFSRSEPQQSQTVTYQRNPDGTVEESNVVIVKGEAVQEEQHPTPAEAYDETK